MSHIPPLFKNFAKGFKDLNEKKFEFNREIKVKTTTLSGVTFETTGRANSKSGDYVGSLRTTIKRADFGTFESEVDTEGSAKATVEANQIKKGVVAKLSFDQLPKGNLDVSYVREFLAVSGGVTVASKNKFDGSASLGFDGLYVGGSATYDESEGQFTDYNAGAEYTQPDFTISVKTANRADNVTTSYLHTVNPDTVVGASFLYNIASSRQMNTVLSLVSSYTLDRDTLAKAKFSSEGVFTAALEQRLYNPKLKYGIASEYNLKSFSATPEKFGLSVAFGDA